MAQITAGTIVASQSLAAAATLTSSVFPYDPAQTLYVSMTNGGTVPSQQVQAILQLSVDNSTWVEVDRRFANATPSGVSLQVFPLAPFAGNMASYFGGTSSPQVWLYYRLVFKGNNDQAVTVAAYIDPPETRITLSLAGGACTAGGGITSWTPPQAGPIIITSSILYVKTASAAVSNVNIGVAANTITSSASLGATLNISCTVAQLADADLAPATPIILLGTNVVTVSSGFNTTGFVGTLFLKYLQP